MPDGSAYALVDPGPFIWGLLLAEGGKRQAFLARMDDINEREGEFAAVVLSWWSDGATLQQTHYSGVQTAECATLAIVSATPAKHEPHIGKGLIWHAGKGGEGSSRYLFGPQIKKCTEVREVEVDGTNFIVTDPCVVADLDHVPPKPPPPKRARGRRPACTGRPKGRPAGRCKPAVVRELIFDHF